jgi:hypothetical protein
MILDSAVGTVAAEAKAIQDTCGQRCSNFLDPACAVLNPERR